MMADELLNAQDLITAKKHDTFHSEVITGKAGGLSTGANIDYATNAVTGQTQTTLPKVLSNVGFSPAGFDFTTGGTLTERDKAIFYQTDGNWYSWGGTLPKVVPPASSPASTGGIADNAWNVSTSAFMYRDWEGFTAELLAQADIVDDGQPDEIGNSQRVEAIRNLISRGQPSISFVFDDAYQSVKTVLKPLFDTYNTSFGIAVPVGSLGNPNRLTLEGVREMYSLGCEIINHASSGDVMSTTAKGIGGVAGELATCWSALANIGVTTTGFQTPSSALNGAYIDTIKPYCDYAFTIQNTQAVMPTGTDPHRLYRFSMEADTQANCVAIVDELKSKGGAVVFYAHDIANGDANYLKIQAILSKAASVGIPVLLPRQCIERSVNGLGNSVKTFSDEQIIFNGVSDYVTTGGCTFAVSGTKDITVSIPAAGTYTLQRVVNLTDPDDIGDLINYSATLRDLTGSIATNCNVGIAFYDATNASGNLLYTSESGDIDLNNAEVRYFAEGVKGLAKSALIYIRLICSAAGSVLVRQPVLRYGTSIAPRKYVDYQHILHSLTIPSQSIAAGAGYQTVALDDVASNGLFAITGNSITFQKNANVCISFSPVASGTGVGTGWAGGAAAIATGAATVAISPVAGGANYLAGQSVLTMTVYRGFSVTLKALASGIALAIGNTNSRLVITEMQA